MFKAAPLKAVVSYIEASTGYRASTTMPTDATKRTPCVVVQRLGTWDTGEPLPEIDRPVLTVWCCAQSAGETYDMADVVTRAMERFALEPHVTYCEQYSAYEDSGPDGWARFKLGYRITYID